MKIAIYTKGDSYLTDKELDMWLVLFKKHGIHAVFNQSFAEQTLQHSGIEVLMYSQSEALAADTELIISYGGDGTFLQCVEMLGERDIPIVGVNSGRMGFLANIPRQQAEESILAIKNGNYSIEERSLLEVPQLEGYALNEFTLQKQSLSMIHVDLLLNDEYVATYMADGLIISTPTGSTAYSMSVGGAIVSPACDALIITPIAPHNLNMRPLIVEGSTTVEVRATGRNKNILVSLDNRTYNLPSGLSFTVMKARRKIRMVKFPANSFYKTIREKLYWGVDLRNGME